MTHPSQKGSIRVARLSACCPEAQADGVPCTELERSCETCERAVTEPVGGGAPAADSSREEPEIRDDSWAV